jgi:hypothetical protein
VCIVFTSSPSHALFSLQLTNTVLKLDSFTKSNPTRICICLALPQVARLGFTSATVAPRAPLTVQLRLTPQLFRARDGATAASGSTASPVRCLVPLRVEVPVSVSADPNTGGTASTSASADHTTLLLVVEHDASLPAGTFPLT